MGHGSNFLATALVTSLLPMILSLSLHEWGHAAVAVALGDQTPREQGRLTLNPVAHIDIFGTVLLPLAMLLYGLPVFGWAKPVQFQPHRFSRKVSMSTGVMLTAAAGPLMNLAIALVAALILAAGDHSVIHPLSRGTVEILAILEKTNVMLFIFNLLPVPPLDGSRVLVGLLPNPLRGSYAQLERYSGWFIGILLLVGGSVIFVPVHGVLNGIDHVAQALFQ